MKKIVFLMVLVGFIAASCSQSGHKSQSWAPKTGKPMKKGHNNK